MNSNICVNSTVITLYNDSNDNVGASHDHTHLQICTQVLTEIVPIMLCIKSSHIILTRLVYLLKTEKYKIKYNPLKSLIVPQHVKKYIYIYSNNKNRMLFKIYKLNWIKYMRSI